MTRAKRDVAQTSKTPGALVQNTPHAVIGIAEAAAILEASGPAWSAVSKAVGKLRGMPPLVVQIEDSTVDDRHHCIELRLTNQTPHALYLDSIAALQPKAATVLLQQITIERSPTAVYTAFPARLHASGVARMTLHVPRSDALAVKNTAALKLRLACSPLDEPEPKHIDFDVRLRHAPESTPRHPGNIGF